MVIPANHPGNDRQLNWSLCMHQVAPAGDAYRNLSAEEILKMTSSEGKRTLATQTDETEPVHPILYRDPACHETLDANVKVPVDPRAESVPTFRYNKLFEKVTGELEASEALYVSDWAVAGYPLRVITDDVPTALFLRTMTGGVNAIEDPTLHADSASVVYHCSKLNVVEEGIKMSSKAFSVVNPSFNTVILGGTRSKPALIDAISSLVANNLALDEAYGASKGMLLRCDCLSSGGASLAVFGDTALVNMMDELSGAHAHILTAEGGLVRVFQGVSRDRVSPKPSLGDLVEAVTTPAGSFERVTSWLPAASPAPLKAAVLVVDEGTKTLPPLAQLTPDQVLHHYLYGGGVTAPCFSSSLVDAAAHAEAFAAAMEKANTPVFLLNKAAVGSVAATQILRALVRGEAMEVKAHKGLGMTVVSSLGSVDPAVLKATGILSVAIKKLAGSRQTEMVGFLGTVSDRVIQGGLSGKSE